MKKISIAAILLTLFVSVYGSPLHTSYKRTVIIDTDCAIDDLRAISILLSLPTITIKAIMVSDGSLAPAEGVQKVRSLLRMFNADTIPVMCGNPVKGINPLWRTFNQKIHWGDPAPSLAKYTSLQDIAGIIQNSPEHISLICLGALTNIDQLLTKHAAIYPKIEELLWYTESASPLKGFNYECDPKAANSLINSGITIKVISNLNNNEAVFDTMLYNTCKNAGTQLAQTLYNAHNDSAALEMLQQNHFKLWDELVALYLINPELFTVEPVNNKVRHITQYNARAVKEIISDLITGVYRPGEYVALYGFPVKRELYTYDVRLIMDSAITRHGLEEWKACVLTDEFHGHLGVFSIVGAKMGMYARDFFGVGTDHLKVLSFAGKKPPYSCMNDGIQVSTGATLGQGTIDISPDSITSASAIFTLAGISIKLSLKPEYLQQINSDIKKGVTQFGLEDPNYWSFIRQCALKYWKDWDRKEIFEMNMVKTTKQ